MRLTSENTLCLVIDIQEKLLPAVEKKEDVLENNVKLLNCFQHLSVPCIITEQYRKGLGETVSAIKEAAGEESPIMEKMTFSAYLTPEIKEKIKESGRKNIVITGIEAHVCVLQSLIDLQNDGFQTMLVTDCISSRQKKDKKGAIQRAVFEGGIVTTYEAIVFELMQAGGTDTFKQVMKFVK